MPKASPADMIPEGTAPNDAQGRTAMDTPQRSSAQDIAMTRELFWNNVIREMLSTLSTASAMGPAPNGIPGVDRPSHPADVLDGRLAIVTTLGNRIAIASVTPLFACGVPGSAADRALSMDVECTVFEVRTPKGEVFTLPLHEIRAFHALTDELMQHLRQSATEQAEAAKHDNDEPFGFAAFTSLARTRKNADVPAQGPHFTGPFIDQANATTPSTT